LVHLVILTPGFEANLGFFWERSSNVKQLSQITRTIPELTSLSPNFSIISAGGRLATFDLSLTRPRKTAVSESGLEPEVETLLQGHHC
ncbi:hypothetical protein AVEN_129539-1, partial [Araneus ventricosus]